MSSLERPHGGEVSSYTLLDIGELGKFNPDWRRTAESS